MVRVRVRVSVRVKDRVGRTSLTVAPPCARRRCCFLVMREGLRQSGAAAAPAACDGGWLGLGLG